MNPMRNQTTLKQERYAFELFKQLVSGKNISYSHMLYKIKLNADDSKGWGFIPELRWEYGLYDHTAKQVYNAFLRIGAMGARGAVIHLSITDDSVCGLIRRYSTSDEMKIVWNWPTKWIACEHYKHSWCNVRLSAQSA